MNLMGVYLLINQNKKRINIMKLEDYLKEQLKKPEFRKEYEALEKSDKFLTFPMKTKLTLVSCESCDWEALYINDKLTAEGHSIKVRDFIDCINDILPNEYSKIEVSDEIAEIGMPEKLSELKEV